MGGKGQKLVQNDKKVCPLQHSISQEPFIIWLSFMIHICKMIISSGVVFIFSKFWFYGSIGGKTVKGRKTVQNDKNFSMSRTISQEPYIIWLSFMVQMCKMIISPDVFFKLKFWFFRLSGGWNGKKWPKMTKVSVCGTLYFSNHISYDLHLWYTCMYKRIIFPGIFFFFFLQNFDFQDH